MAVRWEGSLAIKLAGIAKYHLDAPPADLKRLIDADSGPETSAWAGETGFDAVIEPFKKQAADLGEIDVAGRP